MLAQMYKKVEPLLKNKALKIAPLKDHGYSKDVTRVMVTYEEISEVVKSYVLYFAKDVDGIVPMAVLGLEDKNQFLDKNNKWEQGLYIPSTVLAYPLGMALSGDKKDSYTLVYDGEYEGINASDGKDIVTKDGDFTEFGQKLVDFLQNLQGSLNSTKIPLNILEEYNLLKFADVDLSVKDKQYKVAKIGIIDEEVFKNLDDKQILELVKKGVYRIILLHFISLNNINRLVNRLK
jgi:hypothetical protein